MEEIFAQIIEKWGGWGVVIVGLFLLYQQNNILNDRIAEQSEKYMELVREVMAANAENRETINGVVEMYQAISGINEMVMGFIEQSFEQRSRND